MAADANVIDGGPGTPAPAHGSPAPDDSRGAPRRAAAAPAPKVVLDGVEYEVTPALAGALQKERDRVAGAYGSRLQQYERRLAALESQDDEPEAPAPAELQPPNAKWLDATSDDYDPERYHRENLAYQHALVEAGL